MLYEDQLKSSFLLTVHITALKAVAFHYTKQYFLVVATDESFETNQLDKKFFEVDKNPHHCETHNRVTMIELAYFGTF